MSFSVTEAFVASFGTMIFPLAEQKGSRLRNTVTVESGVVGKKKSFERLGPASAALIASRHADTVYGNIAHSRRWANLADRAAAELIDELDKVKMLIEPQSSYRDHIMNALGRDIDRQIIAAINGSATEGEEGGTLVPLPAAQKIAAGATGFTLAKWRQAKKILDDAEVEDDGRTLVIDSKALNLDLLADATLTSSDFNTVKALVNGEVKSFLGFEVVRTQLLEKSGSDWLALAYHKRGVGLAIGADMSATIDRMPNKNNATQVYARMSTGAVRIEDARVVQIAYVP